MTAELIADPEYFVRRLIEGIARRLVLQGAVDRGDRDDVEQDLFLMLLARLGDFDAKRGTPAAFCRMVLSSAVRMLLRGRRAAKRGHGHVVRGGPALRRIADEAADPGLDVRLDVRAAMALLPADQCDLALRLTSRSRADVARDLRVARTTLNRRVDKLKQSLVTVAPTLCRGRAEVISATTSEEVGDTRRTQHRVTSSDNGRASS
jgi:DNA-directed RNA polymerase specialized sigma24 family protein